MDKKICLITGATSGMGKEAAVMIAKENYNLVFTSRNLVKAEETKRYIIEKSGNSDIEYFFCDLASLKSISDFYKEFKEKYNKIDVLINNAGTWEFRLNLSEDGFEKTFAVNHLSHFYLTLLVLDLLLAAKESRIINVASAAHKYARFNFDDPDSAKEFDFLKVYANSKLANIWFTNVLAQKLKSQNVTVNSLMPGVIVSDLLRNLPFPIKQLGKLLSKPTIEGAKTIVRLAISDDVKGMTGTYFDEFRIGKMSKEAVNFEKAQKFWELSEEMINSKISNFQAI